ncbi:hypothetical protein TrLO_g2963 [Triparma laevis f. longispina]|uniref:DUF1294 domain-containing protein n=1 Tax=Triparma laevis f. longispina TaxID=1714387 RepID=A0A9W7E4U9_9STRA|nr:hypothetical protein TrLO_g2963 [Triparma laevis f. longispina]
MYLGPIAGTLSLRYHITLDIIAFLISLYDKLISKSSLRLSRIPESTFYLLSFLGGGWGLLSSFIIFNHKVRKSKFLFKCFCGLLLRILLYSIIS